MAAASFFGPVFRFGVFPVIRLSILIGTTMPAMTPEHHPDVRDYKDTDNNWQKISAREHRAPREKQEDER